MSNSCKFIPEADNGKPSQLFRDINARVKDRTAAKKIWAFTKTKMFMQEFSDLPKDENGEITYEALDRVLGLNKIFSDKGKDNALAIEMGITDSFGRPRVYEDPDLALSKVNDYNDNAKNTVADIIKTSDGKYHTNVSNKTVISMAHADRNKARAKLNKTLIAILNRIGFDVTVDDNLDHPGIFDPTRAEWNADVLKTAIAVSNNEEGAEALPEEFSHLILAGLKNHTLKKRVDALFTEEVVRRVLGKDYNKYYKAYKNGRTPIKIRLREEAEGKVLAAILKNNPIKLDDVNIVNIRQNEYTDEFRRLQEASSRLSEREIQLYHTGAKRLSDESRRTLGAAYARLLSGRGRNVSQFEPLNGKGNTFNIAQVNGSLFHDIFEINRSYLQNGELVDLHDNYEDCKCFLSDDGLCGFAIEPDGNLISVFSLNPSNRGGFLYAISDFAKDFGATHLDAFASDKQNLEKIYEKTLGFKTISRMDYNMDYDHDDIAENHGSPDVVFMGDAKNGYAERRFNGEQYDEAVAYQKANLKTKNNNYTGIPGLITRTWDYAKGLLRKTSASEIDNAIAEAHNAMNDIRNLIESGEIDPIIDIELIKNHEAMHDLNAQMEKMESIAEEGEIMLSKRLDILKHTHDTGDNSSELNKTIFRVRDDIEKQKYYSACSRVLASIGREIIDLEDKTERLGFIHNGTTDLNMIHSEAELVRAINSVVSGYMPYVTTIMELPKLVSNGEINMDEDAAKRLASMAGMYKEHLESMGKEMKQLRFAVLKQLITLYYGDMGNAPSTFEESETVKWKSVDTILRYANSDISWWDTNVFSAGDSRNPLLNVIHKIVVSQQAARNNKINKACARMQEADKRLRDAGHSNDFVYQLDADGVPTGYYVGPRDFDKFDKERKAFIDSLDENSMDTYEFQDKINEWENKHLEEVEVGEPLPDGSVRIEVMPRMYDEEGNVMYAVTDFDANWDQAQKDYYNALINMKAEMDEVLPASMWGIYNAPQVRKSVTQMFDNGCKSALRTIFGNWKRQMAVTVDNVEYANRQTTLDFNNKEVKRVPIYFIQRLENQKDLSTDATHAMFNYITMAVNYGEMNKLAAAMSLMQDYVSDTSDEGYDVRQTDADKPVIDSYFAAGRTYWRQMVKRGEGTNVSKAITNYIDRQFFGETKKRLGNVNAFGLTVSKDALANLILRMTSVSRIGFNVLSGITNVTQGETQIIQEAATGRYFNGKDYAWAKKEYGKLLPEYMGKFNAADRHDKMYMLINQFNSSEDFFRDMRDKDFNKSAAKRVLGRGNVYFLNTMGEHYLHTAGMLMILNHEKVKRLSDNKEVSLYEVIKQVHDDNGWHLELDDDIQFLDGNKAFLQGRGFQGGIVRKSDRDALFEGLALYINNINAAMHGGYSEAEKGNINQHILLTFFNQFRQWMWGMYNKLYSRSYYDAVMGIQKEGVYVSLWKFMQGLFHDMKSMSIKEAIHNNQLTPDARKGLRVAFTQASIMGLLWLICSMTMGWKDDDDRSKRLLAYSIRRLNLETGALFPLPHTFMKNIFTLVQSPAAGVKTLEGFAQLLNINNYWTEINSGRFKGWSRAEKAIYTLTPVYNVQKLIDMKDYNYMFNIFKQ